MEPVWIDSDVGLLGTSRAAHLQTNVLVKNVPEKGKFHHPKYIYIYFIYMHILKVYRVFTNLELFRHSTEGK